MTGFSQEFYIPSSMGKSTYRYSTVPYTLWATEIDPVGPYRPQ